MNKNFLHLFLVASLLLFVGGCKDSSLTEVDSTVDKAQVTGTGWNFTTNGAVTVSVTASDLQNSPIALTGVELYAKYPKIKGSSNWDLSVSPFTTGQTDANGFFTKTFTLEDVVDTIYLYIKNMSYSEPIAIPVTSSSISLNLHPAGYSSTKSGKLRATTGAESPWKYEINPYSTASNLWILGNYDAKGYPNYFVGRDTYSSTFIGNISNSFPERTNMIAAHPELFKDGSNSNLETTASCNIWISFVAEGAWNNNAVGYFYYPTGSTPTSDPAIAKRIVMFPNAQDASGNSGSYLGEMVRGDKVELKYYNESTGTWSDTFPAGITIGWFIIGNGYSTETQTAGNKGMQLGSTFYSLPGLNSDKTQHNVIYFDKSTQNAVIGFEDTNMATGGGSDKDFNDVVFTMSANPITAIKTDSLPLILQTTSNDKDGDGVIDANDKYPNDPQRAYDEYYPTSGTGTLAFEDNWPNQGDYDFNDLVVGYRYHLVTNADGYVKDVDATYSVKAVGALYRNGFAVQFGTGPGNVESVSGQRLTRSLFSISSNGYENEQSYAVIPVFDDAHALFGYTATATTPYINTESSGTNSVTADPVDVDLKVTFYTPVNTKALGSAPYNAFLVVNQDRGKEVHLAGQVPTSKANPSYLGTGDDKTNTSTRVYYRNSSNFPWALDIPSDFDYPLEKARVDAAYLHYGPWATSVGASYTDWYSNKASGYRNSSKLHKK